MSEVEQKTAEEVLETTQNRILRGFGQTTELLGRFIIEESNLPEGETLQDSDQAADAVRTMLCRAVEAGFNSGRDFERQQVQPTEGEE